jgi:8-oxo-dGTP pyrophosphatase MutT (NUDIX family)
MQPHPFADFLSHRLADELPGLWAQVRMAPLPLDNRQPSLPQIRRDARRNSVLALMVPRLDTLNLVLTLRSQCLGSHSGQISFPGGTREPNETPLETALRETEEEIGVLRSAIQVVGSLTPLYIPPSNNYVRPFVGFAQQEPSYMPNPAEVEEIFEVNIDCLIDPQVCKDVVQELRGVPHRVPFWDIHPSTPLWGATAMMLSELSVLYAEYRGVDLPTPQTAPAFAGS